MHKMMLKFQIHVWWALPQNGMHFNAKPEQHRQVHGEFTPWPSCTHLIHICVYTFSILDS